MPMRGELATPAERTAQTRDEAQPWVVIGCCAVGFLAAIDVALRFVPANHIGLLIAQHGLG